jgi:glycosyltransferase involved in cell wall biosynthesis
MRILFVHPYFPGQFQRLASYFHASDRHEVVAFHRGLKDGRETLPIAGIKMIEYGNDVQFSLQTEHPLRGTEQFLREAASMAFQAQELRNAGWQPDLVYSHGGWGSAAFLHDVFPKAKYVRYCEWFYNNGPETTEFLTNERGLGSRIATNLRNLPILADLIRSDLLISPTDWQKSQFPTLIAKSIETAPDGVDTQLFRPDPHASFTTESGRIFRPGDRVITYVARGADPVRGFKPFMRALSLLQARDPLVEAIIVGDRKVYYAAENGTEEHFHDVVMSTKVDPARTHYAGRIPYDAYRRVLQVSAAHVFLTAPFVLSWSALEALSTGCAMVASDTAPVQEFVTHGENGLLVDFFSAEDIAEKIAAALEGGPAIQAMRERARQTILARWSLGVAIERHKMLVRQLGLPLEDGGGRIAIRRKAREPVTGIPS